MSLILRQEILSACATGTLHSLIPLEALPEACRMEGCQLRIFTNGIASSSSGVTFTMASGTVVIVHEVGEQRSEYVIREEDVNNFDLYIWGDQVRPWIVRLHEEAIPMPPSAGGCLGQCTEPHEGCEKEPA